MIDSQSAARRPRRTARLAAAAAVLLAVAPAAKAQGLFPFFGGGPSPSDIARGLDASGYALTGPLIRRGDVYLVDVMAGGNDFERLVIDAETGRIIERFRTRPPRWRQVAPGDWSQGEADAWNAPQGPPGALDRPPARPPAEMNPPPPSPTAGLDRPPPRPPAEMNPPPPSPTAGLDRPPPSAPLALPGARREPPAKTGDQLARGDAAPKPTVIFGGDARSSWPDSSEKSKAKARDAKRKTAAPETAAAPAAPVAATPPVANAAPAAPVANAAPPAPVAATAPAADAAPVASPPPPSQTAKADAPASVVAAKSPPPAPAPEAHAPAKSKAVNDLPVTPLD